MTNVNSKPLVSIVVRTKDRPKLLSRAIKSIAAQTYRPIEVLLVNDGGCDLDVKELNGILGDIPLNYIRLEKNTGRAHAGNVGIENTRGEYIGFLDDDDEFYPDHILTLASFLEQSEYKVAYTGTEMVYKCLPSQEGNLVDDKNIIVSKEFSYNNLLAGNYIPFNSVLFSREALCFAERFDETFELYEDWDLLIRIGQRYPFSHIKEITAKYNQWSRELQINQADTDYMKDMYIRVIRKHWEKISPVAFLDIREAIAKDKDVHITNLEKLIRNLEAAIKDKDVHITNLEALIRNLEAAIKDKEKP